MILAVCRCVSKCLRAIQIGQAMLHFSTRSQPKLKTWSHVTSIVPQATMVSMQTGASCCTQTRENHFRERSLPQAIVNLLPARSSGTRSSIKVLCGRFCHVPMEVRSSSSYLTQSRLAAYCIAMFESSASGPSQTKDRSAEA